MFAIILKFTRYFMPKEVDRNDEEKYIETSEKKVGLKMKKRKDSSLLPTTCNSALQQPWANTMITYHFPCSGVVSVFLLGVITRKFFFLLFCINSWQKL